MSVAQHEDPGDAKPTSQMRRFIVCIQLDDQPITPATVRFMRRGLREAAKLRAECLVIELDTPGGVLQSTQEFVTDILGSTVPVGLTQRCRSNGT